MRGISSERSAGTFALKFFIFNFLIIFFFNFLTLPPPELKTHLFLCTGACFGLMHSGIIHADGSSDFRYSKSMALLLYTSEYAFGSFV